MSGPEIRRLYDGTRNTGLTVRPDPQWPGMWRIHYPDGTVSDMVNISRATDAALSWLSRNAGHGNSHNTFNWKAVQSAPEQRTAAQLPQAMGKRHG